MIFCFEKEENSSPKQISYSEYLFKKPCLSPVSKTSKMIINLFFTEPSDIFDSMAISANNLNRNKFLELYMIFLKFTILCSFVKGCIEHKG